REPNGIHVAELGVCPAASNNDVDGIHNGKNGGRCCWIIINSAFEGDTPHGFCLNKIQGCRECNFYLFLEKSEKLLFAA
ncbi:MAG: hypothetical protein D3922_05350, partial [Candidatus Electrothrix sp. AR1]|nr:hypothetical protein [Candidatus Electrothrix sp. AR1]